ncbi:MAG: hypothetical protein K0V04_28225 [Deltaproteobacteria bacterium]|nr:hypothetical protein [Deltaproteobacteria bacterium]
MALLLRWTRLGEAALARRHGVSLRETLRACRELLVVAAWTRAGGNVTVAARKLGVSRKTVRMVVHGYGQGDAAEG